MKVFVTGAESFIGSALWDLCAKAGHEVSGMDIVPSGKPNVARVDLRDPQLEKYVPAGAAVIHLAAVSTDPLCKANPLEALDINLTGTLRLAKAALEKQCSQFIFASTEWVYGDVANDEVQSEDRPIDVTRVPSLYAFTKLAGERILAFSGLENVTVLRFGIVYGPREKNWSAVEQILEKVRCGEKIEVGSLKTGRRFIHVEDLCAGIVAAVGQRGRQCFNLSGDRMITLADILNTSQEVLGTRIEAVETAPDKPSLRNPDNRRAVEVLGWRPRVAFEAGVRSLAGFLKERAKSALL